jgi:hypothetical protein
VSELRIVADDVIELGGVPVARLLPCLKLSLRDELTWAFDVAAGRGVFSLSVAWRGGVMPAERRAESIS